LSEPVADGPPAPAALPQPASRHALGLLRFPDPRTDWVVVMVATLPEPAGDLDARLRELHRHVPMVGARLRDEVWHPGEPAWSVVDGEPLDSPELVRAFDLADEPPLRILLGADGTRLGLAGHHAAFDGLSLVALLIGLLGGELPAPVASPPPGPPGSKVPLLKRLARPADRVAPSRPAPVRDSFATAEVEISGRDTTGRLAAACVAAADAHNRRHNARWDKVGITIAKGGPAGVGNVASYRRIDLAAGEPVVAAVTEALATPDEPAEQVNASKLLRLLTPVVDRFSDSILLSNLGRQDVPGVERIDFFPVARGRSAVAFASATVRGGRSTLTIRARDLSPAAARSLLDDAVRGFVADSKTASAVP
jgi:hypothetical protein